MLFGTGAALMAHALSCAAETPVRSRHYNNPEYQFSVDVPDHLLGCVSETPTTASTSSSIIAPVAASSQIGGHTLTFLPATMSQPMQIRRKCWHEFIAGTTRRAELCG